MAIDTQQELQSKLSQAIANAKILNDRMKEASRKLPAEVPTTPTVPAAPLGQK